MKKLSAEEQRVLAAVFPNGIPLDALERLDDVVSMVRETIRASSGHPYVLVEQKKRAVPNRSSTGLTQQEKLDAVLMEALSNSEYATAGYYADKNHLGALTVRQYFEVTLRKHGYAVTEKRSPGGKVVRYMVRVGAAVHSQAVAFEPTATPDRSLFALVKDAHGDVSESEIGILIECLEKCPWTTVGLMKSFDADAEYVNKLIGAAKARGYDISYDNDNKAWVLDTSKKAQG